MTTELHFLTLAEGARRIRAGELTPVAWVEALLARIQALNPVLNAFLDVTAELALAQARAAEAELARSRRRGPLHGVPYALKDIIDTAGIVTTGGSRLGLGRTPARDAHAVRRLRAAGAVLLGKLTTHEFAYGGPSFDLPAPPARNPWDVKRFGGGSSSGSGVAVAAGLVPVALGSDTGGSIRHPAAHCGIVGLKPTQGLVGRTGLIPLSPSMDCCGPMTWTVEDCALVLGAIAGFDAEDAQSVDRPVPDYSARLDQGVKGLRIGLVRHFYRVDKETHPAITAAVEQAIEVLAGLGAEIVEVKLSPLADYAACQWVVTCAEANAIHDHDMRGRLADYGDNFRHRILPGAVLGAVDYVQAQRQRRRLLAEMATAFERVDLLATATLNVLAPRFEEITLAGALASRSITSAFNVGAGPALALCCGFSDEGLPLSLTLAGRPFDEATVFRAGHAYERATPWRSRRPEVPAEPVPAATPAWSPPQPAAGERNRIQALAAWSGIEPTEREFGQLVEALPLTERLVDGLPRNLPRWDEPAGQYRAGDWEKRQ